MNTQWWQDGASYNIVLFIPSKNNPDSWQTWVGEVMNKGDDRWLQGPEAHMQHGHLFLLLSLFIFIIIWLFILLLLLLLFVCLVYGHI